MTTLQETIDRFLGEARGKRPDPAADLTDLNLGSTVKLAMAGGIKNGKWLRAELRYDTRNEEYVAFFYRKDKVTGEVEGVRTKTAKKDASAGDIVFAMDEVIFGTDFKKKDVVFKKSHARGLSQKNFKRELAAHE